jgi:hypothetical protein
MDARRQLRSATVRMGAGVLASLADLSLELGRERRAAAREARRARGQQLVGPRRWTSRRLHWHCGCTPLGNRPGPSLNAGRCSGRDKRRWVRIWPSLCRQPRRIRANDGELSRVRIRRWRARTNKCELSRTGLQSPCKRKVVSSILTGGSRKAASRQRSRSRSCRPSRCVASDAATDPRPCGRYAAKAADELVQQDQLSEPPPA